MNFLFYTHFMIIREKLINITLEWEQRFGIAPMITSALSEYDAALIVGMEEEEYSKCLIGRTAVSKGHDFEYKGKKYQVKANRPSGKVGSNVTLVSKAKNYDWDYLIWILYNEKYEIQEVWQWDVAKYIEYFGEKDRLSPDDMRKGLSLLSNPIKDILNCIGKECFIKHYWIFKDINVSNQGVIKQIEDEYTLNSKHTRTSKAKKLFKENNNLEALKIIIKSRVNSSTIKLAKDIYYKETGIII